MIPARDSEGSIKRCVESVREQVDRHGRGVRVVVVDDGSVDATGRLAEEAGAEVLRATGEGPAKARNLGVRAADTPLVIFTDADCAPRAGFVASLLAAFDNPQVAGAKGAYESEQRSWVARFVQCEYEERYARMARRESIDFIDTYAAAYRRDVFDSVGGFDERYRLPSTEDQELSFRIAEQGHRMVFVAEARVGHLHVASLWGYARKKAKIGYYKVATLRRHPGKAVQDSHTPPSLKLQLLLAPVVLLGALGPLAVLLGKTSLGGAVAVVHLSELGLWGALPLAVFLLTSLPLWARVVLRDPVVGVAVPVFVLIRAIALGCGVALGIFGELRGGILPQANGTEEGP